MPAGIIDILRDLVRFRSITPCDDGAIAYCCRLLEQLGFSCKLLTFNGVNNLYARRGNSLKNLCFAGHIDVVPPLSGWSTDPFELTIKNGAAYGRGTNDMKGPLSSCISAISEIDCDTSISVMLTSDEEIMGEHGTKRIVNFLRSVGEKVDACVLCESCSAGGVSGEYIKIGCRGSLNIDVCSSGKQCHVVSAPLFGNHLHRFAKTVDILCNTKLDIGTEDFSPSSIQMTAINCENYVRNIVPMEAKALFNVRFNDKWTFESLEKYIVDSVADGCKIAFGRSGYPFVGAKRNGVFVNNLKDIIGRTIGSVPQIGTDGGNSDAVFIKEITNNVVEIGSPICNAHVTDEFITISDLDKLKNIYKNIMINF